MEIEKMSESQIAKYLSSLRKKEIKSELDKLEESYQICKDFKYVWLLNDDNHIEFLKITNIEKDISMKEILFSGELYEIRSFLGAITVDSNKKYKRRIYKTYLKSIKQIDEETFNKLKEEFDKINKNIRDDFEKLKLLCK